MNEQAVLFGERNPLVGVVTAPVAETDRPRPAVILLNPGIVHRVGPGRIYVKIARALAAAGFVVLRFDFAGIGDSAVRRDSVPFSTSAIQEAQAAMDFLHTTRGVADFILMGGCSGATVSLDVACHDRRVIGSVLMNFPVLEEDEDNNPDFQNRNAAHYYRHFALFNLKSWHKLLTGKASYGRMIRTLAFQIKQRLRPHQLTREASKLRAKLKYLSERSVLIHFIYSESDRRLDDLQDALGSDFKRLCAPKKARLRVIPRADHTFSSLHDHAVLLPIVLEQVKVITEVNTRNKTEPPVLPGIETALSLNLSDVVAKP